MVNTILDTLYNNELISCSLNNDGRQIHQKINKKRNHLSS